MNSGIKAKSDGESLEDHILSCLRVFSSLREIFPDIDKKIEYPAFFSDVFNALFFHDFGKAATDFQQQLETGKRWHYRHEILSIPFVDSLPIEDTDIIKLLILTHHKDLDDLIRYTHDEPEIGPAFQDRISELTPNLNGLSGICEMYPQLSREYLGEDIRLRPINPLGYTPDCWERIITDTYRCLRNGTCRNKLKFIGIFGRGFVNSCDHLASAGITKVLKPLPSLDDLFRFPTYTSIQRKSRETRGDAIIHSPTGSGKTEAALFWATANLNSTGGSRVFYVLPYTASINAMFLRLENKFRPRYDEVGCVSLLHGRASYFLSRMSEDERDFRLQRDVARKIYSPYKVLTPFQLLKHLFSIKGYEMGLLEMYQGVFILDEIHAYDARTAALILSMCEFVRRDLDGKILLMSATLPEFIRKLFVDTLEIQNTLTMDRNELDRYTRHRCTLLDGGIFDHLDEIRERIRNGDRVLIVCNTVKQAQEVYARLKDTAGRSALLHSKFILRDRERIERDVESLNLLVGTQAIEVSLDIDYDVCFSEPAPIDALIQRFGRVNRRREKGISDVFILTTGSEYDSHIYDESIVRKTLDELSNIEILHEWQVQEIADVIYQAGFGKEEKTFNDTRDIFCTVIDGINPFDSDRSESDYYKLFDTIEAVPETFRTDYVTALQNGDLYGAMQYTLPLRAGQYHRLKKEDRISRSNGMLFVDARYDPDLGLLVDQRDTTAFIE